MPRTYCVAYGCLNSATSKPELSYFKLPVDFERRSQWLRLISREDLMNKPPQNYTVCEDHFKTMDILTGTHRKKLKTNSLPSLHLPDVQKKDAQTLTEAPKLIEIGTQTEENVIPSASDSSQNSRSPSLDNPQKRKLKPDLLECRKKLHKAKINIKTEDITESDPEDNPSDSNDAPQEPSTDNDTTKHLPIPIVSMPPPVKSPQRQLIRKLLNKYNKPTKKQTASLPPSQQNLPQTSAGSLQCNTLASIWVEKLEKLDPVQKLFAEKAINDILFEAQLGNLNKNSVKINVPASEQQSLVVSSPSPSSSHCEPMQ